MSIHALRRGGLLPSRPSVVPPPSRREARALRREEWALNERPYGVGRWFVRNSRRGEGTPPYGAGKARCPLRCRGQIRWCLQWADVGIRPYDGSRRPVRNSRRGEGTPPYGAGEARCPLRCRGQFLGRREAKKSRSRMICCGISAFYFSAFPRYRARMVAIWARVAPWVGARRPSMPLMSA